MTKPLKKRYYAMMLPNLQILNKTQNVRFRNIACNTFLKERFIQTISIFLLSKWSLFNWEIAEKFVMFYFFSVLNQAQVSAKKFLCALRLFLFLMWTLFGHSLLNSCPVVYCMQCIRTIQYVQYIFIPARTELEIRLNRANTLAGE